MQNFIVHQLTDANLAQYGYLVISNGEAAAVDPARDIEPILALLKAENATLKAVIETHPHADFVSGHLELSSVTGAPVYISKLVGAEYTHVGFDTGDSISLGTVTLEAINTAGHSPDSISILLRDETDKEQVLFSGDTLFAGDVGRPDLREKAGNIQAKREELAGMMYDTVQNILKKLPDHVVVYPAHGAGTLCGKALRDASSTTIGEERATNPSFKEMTKTEFVTRLTEGQPYIPQYFPFEVGINKAGAAALEESLKDLKDISSLPEGILLLDTRSADAYNAGHIAGALHIAESGLRFETWVGTVIAPDENFIVIVQDAQARTRVLHRIAAIGYEKNIRGVFVGDTGTLKSQALDIDAFTQDPSAYTIIDVRQTSEADAKPVFSHALNIPLHELRLRVQEIPQDRPIAVHCAGGYRSMVGESIVASHVLAVPVFDIGERILSISMQ